MRDLGYDFWEWSAGAAFNPAKDDAWWQRQKEEIAKRPLPLRSCNQFIPGKFRLTGPKADHAPALDYAEKILRRADEIGVNTVPRCKRRKTPPNRAAGLQIECSSCGSNVLI